MKKIIFSLSLFCILQINLVTTKAQLYWSESFGEYATNQNIAGATVNGAGLSGVWSYQGSTATPGATIKNTSTLASSGLFTDPNYLSNGNLGYSNFGVGFTMTTASAFYNAYKADGSTGLVGYKAGGNNEFWYSVLVRADLGTAAQTIGFTQIINGFNPAWNLGNFFLKRATDGTWTLNEWNGSTTLSSLTYPSFTSAVGATTLVVIKVNYASSATTYTVYLNPTPGTHPAPTDGLALTTSTAQKFTGLTFYGGNAASLSIDEMRIGGTYADVTPADAPDTTPPSVPTNFNASNTTSTSVDLSWTASTDNVAVTGYKVYYGTTFVGLTTSTTMRVYNLTPNTAYSFTVVAQDAKLNTGTSSAVAVNTLASLNASVSYTEYTTVPTVSNTDLLKTSASLTYGSASYYANLTDGSAVLGTSNVNIPQIYSGSTIEYTFNTTVNTLGYDLSAIDIFTGWSTNGRVNPNVTVSYSLIGSPTIFNAIGTATYTSATTAMATKSSISGLSISGVAALRFDFGTQQNGYVGYSEIDVFGSLTSNNPTEIKVTQNTPLIYSKSNTIVVDLSTVGSSSFVSVIDSKGSVIKTLQSTGGELIQINVPNKGVHMVRIQNGDKLTTQKVVL
jgi:Fibronectin type III domain